MIRIDEIYYNIFVKYSQSNSLDLDIQWFDPFGSSAFSDLCNSQVFAKRRILFWDQELLQHELISNFFDQYLSVYKNGPYTIITSEAESDSVKWVCDTYGFDSSYYFFHGWAALDWYRGYDRTCLYTPFRHRKINKTFLCPNNIIGGKRRHRLELLSELVDRELVYNNLVSFPDQCPYENKTVAELCKEYNINLASVDLPLKIDTGTDYARNSHAIDMWSLADQTLLHVITETAYYGKKLHLTEKTFKPIVMQQPFILVSTQGSLEYLKRYGFKTFSDFWDESYDNADDNTRILKIGKLLKELDSLSLKEKQQLQQALIPVVEHNFNWFYSQNFENLLWSELTAMMKSWL